MTRPRLAAFTDADALVAAVDLMYREGFAVADALTPFPVPELTRRLDASTRIMRPAMALFGFGTAILFVALQVYSQAYAYPLNSGGRPLASWAVYYLVPFETGVLAAALAGFAVLLWRCDLPRLHHPLFAVPGVERATQDRFILVVDGPADEDAGRRLRDALLDAGALSVGEVGS